MNTLILPRINTKHKHSITLAAGTLVICILQSQHIYINKTQSIIVIYSINTSFDYCKATLNTGRETKINANVYSFSTNTTLFHFVRTKPKQARRNARSHHSLLQSHPLLIHFSQNHISSPSPRSDLSYSAYATHDKTTQNLTENLFL